MYVHIPEPPGLLNVSAKAECPNISLAIQWTVSGNGGSDIINYTLRYRNGDVSTWSNTLTLMVLNHGSLTQQGGSYNLTGLKSGTVYYIQVEATNSIGSRTSDVVSQATLSGVLLSLCWQSYTVH